MEHSSSLIFPPVECLLAAVAAARCGSFSAAASEIGVTHAAISRRVAGAEVWAGTRLFERHGRGVRPTPEGQRLLTRLVQHFADIDALVDRGRRPRVQQTVRLAVTPSLARLWLMPRLVTLERDDLRIDVLASTANIDLASGAADLAIRYGRGGWNIGDEWPLFSEALIPVGVGLSADAATEEIVARALLHAGDTALWRAFAKQHRITLRQKAADRSFADYALCLDAATAGLGVALWNPSLHSLPSPLAANEINAFVPPIRHFLIQPTPQRSVAATLLAERLRDAAIAI